MNRYVTTLINTEPSRQQSKAAAIRRAAHAVAMNSHLSHYFSVGDQWTIDDVNEIRDRAAEALGPGPAPKVFAN
jgi:hypothetical protein